MTSENQPLARAFNPWNPWTSISRCWQWAIPVGLLLAGVSAFWVSQQYPPRDLSTHLLEANQNDLIGVIEPEIQRWEQEVEGRTSKVVFLRKEVDGPSDLSMMSQFRSQLTSLTIEIAVLEAQIRLEDQSETSEADQEDSPTESNDGAIRKAKHEQKLVDLEDEVNGVQKIYDEEKTRLEKLGASVAQLQFAESELQVAQEVLNKLRNRMDQLRTESNQDGAVRSLAPATLPQEPVNSFPIGRMAIMGSAGFLLPWMLGYLIGFKPRRDADPVQSDGDVG